MGSEGSGAIRGLYPFLWASDGAALRSFARSALFHWFRALRAYPRPATRSLEFYNTTSLWFPEWRCFHIEPPCFISCG
jgi:hypothetical protein